jgi:hypothetical protein
MRRGASDFEHGELRFELNGDLNGQAHPPKWEDCVNEEGTENRFITGGVSTPDKTLSHKIVSRMGPAKSQNGSRGGPTTHDAEYVIFTQNFQYRPDQASVSSSIAE